MLSHLGRGSCGRSLWVEAKGMRVVISITYPHWLLSWDKYSIYGEPVGTLHVKITTGIKKLVNNGKNTK